MKVGIQISVFGMPFRVRPEKQLFPAYATFFAPDKRNRATVSERRKMWVERSGMKNPGASSGVCTPFSNQT
jgi:hypothetical protein